MTNRARVSQAALAAMVVAVMTLSSVQADAAVRKAQVSSKQRVSTSFVQKAGAVVDGLLYTFKSLIRFYELPDDGNPFCPPARDLDR